MTAYEQADQERKQLWDRKELVKSQLKDIVNPEELAKQKKRYGILEAMYEEALLRMEDARPPKDKRRKAPKQRRIALYMIWKASLNPKTLAAAKLKTVLLPIFSGIRCVGRTLTLIRMTKAKKPA